VTEDIEAKGFLIARRTGLTLADCQTLFVSHRD
jgi:hypothetical protein